MAIKAPNIKSLWLNYGILGFVAAIGTGFLLKFISQLVSMIPGVALDLQAARQGIAITTTGLGEVLGTGLSIYAKKLFGLIPFVGLPEWIYVGLGGAAFVMLGAWVIDVSNIKVAKTKSGKLATIFVVAAIASGWILSMSIGLPAIGAIIAMVVDALILSWILVAVDESAGLGLTKGI